MENFLPLPQPPFSPLSSLKRLGWKLPLVLGIVLVSSGVFFSFFSFADEPLAAIPGQQVVKEKPKLVSPRPLKDSSLELIGTVLSHETASVYPRREGIVEDILVDIGDRVEKNQVIAKLLPPGVAGKSAGMIAEKRALLNQAQAELENTQLVTEAILKNSQEELAAKMTAIKGLKKNKKSMIEQSTAALETTTVNETARIANAQKTVEISGTQIVQMIDRALVEIASARQTMEIAFYGDFGRNRTNYYSEASIPSYLRIASASLISEIASDLNILSQAESELLVLEAAVKKERVPEVLSLTLGLLTRTQAVLKNGIPGDAETQKDLNDTIGELIEHRSEVLDAKQDLEDAINDHAAVVQELAVMTSEQEKNITTAQKELQTTTTLQDSEVANLNAEIRVQEKNLRLTEAERRQMNEKMKNDLDLAKALYQQEFASSGDREIRSPFSGIISKRFIQVGEVAMPTAPVFELTDVSTSLSKKAKREIQFGLPEDMSMMVDVGKELEFFLASNPGEIYKATVTRKSPQIDLGSRTLIVQARLDDSLQLPRNTSVRVKIPRTSVPIFQIPSQVVVRDDERNFIWVLPSGGGGLEQLSIQVLAEDGELAEVFGEISEQTQILVDPPVGEPESSEK
ncbi:MAG: efflux RND transporter periplasmic adaptor subunit [bacterium]|nr:efflux RND transporter periplasmic adaptor subunit [bacterium]